MESDYKQTEVTYKFFLPDNEDELKTFQKASEYQIALWDINELCRKVWKYEENPSDDRVSLAEEIGNFINKTGALDD